MIFLDTNAVIWLYQANLGFFTAATKHLLEEQDLYVSPMVKLELQYLLEVGRSRKKSEVIINSLYEAIGLQIHSVPFSALIEQSLAESWTRDPFDRLIVSHAKLLDAPLVSKDETILRHYKKAIW